MLSGWWRSGCAGEDRADRAGDDIAGCDDIAVREPEPLPRDIARFLSRARSRCAGADSLGASQQLLAEFVAHSRVTGLLGREDLRKADAGGHRTARGGDQCLLGVSGLPRVVVGFAAQPVRRGVHTRLDCLQLRRLDRHDVMLPLVRVLDRQPASKRAATP